MSRRRALQVCSIRRAISPRVGKVLWQQYILKIEIAVDFFVFEGVVAESLSIVTRKVVDFPAELRHRGRVIVRGTLEQDSRLAAGFWGRLDKLERFFPR